MNLKKYWDKIKSILGLSLQLAKANFKLKNEGSYVGLFWYLLEPLLMFIIILTVRNLVGPDIPNYPLYLLLGLIMFNFFRTTTSDSTSAIIGNADLIHSTKINQEVFVVSSFLASVFAHIFEIIIFVISLLIFNVSILNIIFYPLIFLFFCFFVLGISFILSVISVYITDFGRVWGILTRFLLFATPIFYSSKLALPFNFNIYNPLYYFITIARGLIVYDRVFEAWIAFTAVIFSLLFFIIGFLIFEKFKDKLPEMI